MIESKCVRKERGMYMDRKKFIGKLNKYSAVLQAIGSIFLYFFIECVSRHSVRDTILFMKKSPLIFLYNAFLIFVTFCIVYLFRRRVFVRILMVVFWAGIGITNGVILSYRVTPFTGPDLHLITDAFKIITVYLTVPMIILVVVGIVVAIALLVFLFMKAPKYEGKMNLKVNIPVFILVCASLWGTTQLALRYRIISNYFGNIAFAYEDYGFPYCFVTTVFNTGIDCPPGYSENSIKKVVADDQKSSGEQGEKKPNIIFLQLESFFDPTQVEFLDLSEDPIPNFRKLFQEYSSGYFKVPSVGAGTANTEFEAITGMNLRYFGPGEYPYKTILKKTTCESMSYDLKEIGYTTHAIHNNEATFYDRSYVFSQLGFDTFTSKEYMNDYEETETGWLKDKVLTKQIMDALKSTEGQDYIYTISVQGHGDYTEAVLEQPKIKVSNLEDENKKNAWEYYVNQLYEMDLFIKELVEALSQYDEETVLVMYGDHLPTMGLQVEDLKNRYLFQTEYVIWDNMDLPVQHDNLASYQIGAEVLDRLDLHVGTIFQYHQNRRNTKNYMVDLQDLQYDILYGKQYAYNGENPFLPTELVMGVNTIAIQDVEQDKKNKDNYYIKGDHFTAFSKVKYKDEVLETQFIDEHTLEVVIEDLQDRDSIVVVQIADNSSAEILSETEEYVWKANKKYKKTK